ncbi:MAG: hypothetical protein ACXAC2_23815, partial [Candidatus Kariarchaeaceae archaeon]
MRASDIKVESGKIDKKDYEAFLTVLSGYDQDFKRTDFIAYYTDVKFENKVSCTFKEAFVDSPIIIEFKQDAGSKRGRTTRILNEFKKQLAIYITK